jgi:hypothetical protein
MGLCLLVFAALTVPAAFAQEVPPPTTVPTPAPDPAPAPQPAPKAPPKQPPKPAPRPSSQPSAPPASSGTRPAVVHVQRPAAAKPKQRAKPKVHKKKQHKKKKAAVAKPKVTTTTATTTVQTLVPAVGASSGIPLQPTTTGKGLLFFVIVVALSCAIACLSAAVIPASRVPWRPVALFVWDRQLQLAAAGLALLAAAAMTLILSSGA